MIYKLALIAYVILYNGIIVLLRSYFLYKNTGINPFTGMGKIGKQGLNEKILIFGACLIPLITFCFVYSESLYQYLIPVEGLEIDSIRVFGIGILFGGSIIAIIAQYQMGNSWRTGIDRERKTILITKGIYQYSRNPVYLGILISLIGFFLVAPNVISLCCLAMSFPTVNKKIQIEEEYLLETHNESYLTYKNKVRRWI